MIRRILKLQFLLLWALGLGALVLLALHIYVVATTDHENVLRETTVTPGTDRSRLVVILHGLASRPERMADVTELAAGADRLVPTYDARVLSNLRPAEVTAHLLALLDRIQREHPYERITLIGHSIGALLVRKTYLDRIERGGNSWADRVDRIISLAGMNRGWSMDEKPEHMPAIRYHLIRALHWIGRLSGTGHLVREFHRGSTFVGDLRLQWIRAVHGGTNVAPVLQLLGLTDDVVSREDNMDLVGADNFLFFEVPAGHASVIVLDESEAGRERRKVLSMLLEEADLSELRRTSSFDFVDRERRGRDREVDHIVFVVHGIRDDAEWTEKLAEEIRREADRLKSAGESTDTVRVVTNEYGYFPMGSFLVSPWRQERVRWFVDRVTEELAGTTRADVKVSFVGHSNGTYLLARSLLDYPHLKFENVAFAGSVVPKAYPWARMLTGGTDARVQAFRNDRAASDWVVAVFPRFFEVLAGWTGSKDGWLAELGSGGFNGFLDGPAKSRESVIAGGHGAGVQPENFPSLARFVLTGEGGPPDEITPESNSPSGLVVLLSRICWLLWILLATAILFVGHLATRWLSRRKRCAVPRTVSWPVYVLLVLLLLQSV